MKPSVSSPARRGRALLPLLLLLGWLAAPLGAQGPDPAALYSKVEVQIPMRDGVKLHTVVYAPRDTTRRYPILLNRTPYSAGPYGAEYRASLGPGPRFAEAGYIFVYQDVRGKYLSEGGFVNMTPHRAQKRSPADVDESSDTHDTVEWLLANLPGHNGRVGLWGISYPGFYAAAGIIDGHPAIRAASPQAPIADWWVGDDFHHNGALFLLDAFSFMSSFGRPRPAPTPRGNQRYPLGPDAYRFFLEMGPLANANRLHLKHGVAFWDSLLARPDYDRFWQEKNLLPHLKNVRAAVLVVGGWYDAEDLYGPLRSYAAIEKNNPGAVNTLVMGPWPHGGWARTSGDRLGKVGFGQPTSRFYQEQVEFPFFEHHLKDAPAPALPEALVFRTGANRWDSLTAWPHPQARRRELYFHAGGALGWQAPAAAGHDEYPSDPARPVPYTAEVRETRSREYMTEDQRFAATRPDVLVYQTAPLEEDLTLAGPIAASLFVSTTGTDADFVVKLIDVYPDSMPDAEPDDGVPLGGYQQLVRAEVMRARYRNSFEKPVAMVPGRVTPVRFALQDVYHTFRRGHRLMVQVQSSWFPLVDRNPQRFVDIGTAKASDFRRATHRLYHSPRYPSHLSVGVLPGGR